MERIPEVDDAVVGPWAHEKLRALEAYLDYYTKRLKNQRWKTIYFDAFAGGGRAKIRRRPSAESLEQSLFGEEPPVPEQEEFVRGSPKVALGLSNPFSNYVFVDADPSRVEMLRALKQEYSGPSRVTVRAGTADDQIAWLLSHKPDPRKHRGVAFLDPFGAHLSWNSVAALAQTRVFEVIINFPLHMCLNRLMTKDPNIRASWREQLDAFLPNGWYDEVYEEVDALLGVEKRKRRDASERLLAWYRAKLKDAFGFVGAPRLIRNTKGGPLYYLIWAGPHPAGLAGANYIMRMGN